MEPSRNLLFGVLALRAGLADAESFAAACRRWTSHKETPLADVLQECAGLTPADRGIAEQLVERAVAKHGDADRALRALADPLVWRALAEIDDADLRRWLGELLPGAAWLRREESESKRGWVAAAVLVLLAVVGIVGLLGLVGSAFWLTQVRRHEMMAQAEAEMARAQAIQAEERVRLVAEAQQKRAEANFQAARRAVDEHLTQVSEQALQSSDLKGVRRELLEQATRFYGELLKDQGRKLTGAERGAAHQRMATVLAHLGRDDEALQAGRQALELLRKVATEQPEKVESRLALAATYLLLGRLDRRAHRPAEAEASLRQALAIYTELPTDRGNEPSARAGRADTYLELSGLMKETGRANEAEQARQQAVTLLEKLAAEQPKEKRYAERLKEAQR